MTRLLPPRPRRRLAEPVVPMINVVFLLLIFFLLAAQVGPRPPFAVTPPVGRAEAAEPAAILFVSADGDAAFGTLTGDAAISAAAGLEKLRISADEALDGATLAALLNRLAASGASSVDLTVRGR